MNKKKNLLILGLVIIESSIKADPTVYELNDKINELQRQIEVLKKF